MTTSNDKSKSLPVYTVKDFTSDQDVRWCPGCGDYAVLSTVRKALTKMGYRKEDYVFVSGIGCAARFPYYMDTYGVHSLHGRSLPVATGIKLANGDLQIFVVSGDGDLLSIGGNHTTHMMRRNVDATIILLNNRIYGLTKGQYSPTSEFGKVSSSTPLGSIDSPIIPAALAVAAECTFIARSIDIDAKHLGTVIQRAAAHRGTSFVEVYQDCNIYNHKTWFYASQKDSKAETTIMLEQGEPLIFGNERDKGIRFNNGHPEVVTLGNGVGEEDLIVHDERDRSLAFLYTQMNHPEFPEPLGVLHANPDKPTYDQLLRDQTAGTGTKSDADLQKLLLGSDSWEVE